MTYAEYYNKVYGGWLGKCIGGAAGASVEGIKKLIPCDNFRTMIRPDLPNDDLDLQLLWLEVLKEKGTNITGKDLADAWDKHCWYPFNEYGIFLKNYERGIYPPDSGKFNNPLFSEGEGCPIRSEIWGMVFPQNAEKAAYYAKIDGSVDHSGEAVWIEQYYAAVESEAFGEKDLETLLIKNLKYLPNESRAYQCARLVFNLYQQEKDWKVTREKMLQHYGHFDFTNSVTNFGIALIALLYGKQSIESIINIAFKSGYDTDCTCATAAAIWGIQHGADEIPLDLKTLIGDQFVIGIDIKRTDNSIKKLSKEICDLGIKLAKEEDIIPEKVEYKIEYYGKPAIGIMDQCKIGVHILNHTNEKKILFVKIIDVPLGWSVFPKEGRILVEANEECTYNFMIETSECLKQIHAKNILTLIVDEGNKVYKHKFGIAGASEWKAIGPFFENLEKDDPPEFPSAHGKDCKLPTLECMVNNAVYLEKEYIDESNLENEFKCKSKTLIHAYEDLLPLNEVFTFLGQGCIYLRQEIVSDEDKEVWAVIGNNDGFKLWVNGELYLDKEEIRLWTPYNNYCIVHLKKGKNQIVIKYLKRTENMYLSFAFRKYEGEHFHRKRWCVDLDSIL